MANLSNVTSLTRKVLEIVVVGIIAIVLLFILFQIGIVLKNIFAPAPPPAATVAFGKLAFSSFPDTFDNRNYSYTINTLSGSLPTLPDRITVYKLQIPSPDLLGLDKAKDIAKNAKFLDSPTALSDTSYQWRRNDPLPSTFTIDTQSLDFTLTSNYKNSDTVIKAEHMPDEQIAQTVSQEFFGSVMALPDSIDVSKTKTTLFSIQGTQLIPASSLSNAQIIRVDYFPKAIDKLPIYTANPDDALIYSLVASSDTDYPQIVEANYYHKNVTKETATYPIKSVNKAYDELKSGKGFIAANPANSTDISITNVSLGYYVDTSPNAYLWPIIVFQGDKGFYAYVSAVTDEWVQK